MKSQSKRLLVFDFGGGTCDVALFDLQPPQAGEALRVAPLTVSRYHRLGGGDIDREIVCNVLIPQLVEQNDLSEHELDYVTKSRYLIPALLGAAESIKIALCKEVTRLKKLGNYEQARSDLIQRTPNLYHCVLKNGIKYKLSAPTMSVQQFESVLEPFLDRDLKHARETDYSTTCSIFAPLDDALDRSNCEASDIDLCLMVGGSSLIPQMSDAVENYFSRAKLLVFKDSDQMQTSIAHGAAWQALSLALFGHGIVESITSDSVNIQSEGGPVELIGRGCRLPYPNDGHWEKNDSLVVPRACITGTIDLRVELVDSSGRNLRSAVWKLQPMLRKGQKLVLHYQMDSNHVLHLRLSLDNNSECIALQEFKLSIENPLTNVVNPNAKRERIAALEESIRTELDMSPTSRRDAVQEIAILSADLGLRERALALLSTLNQKHPSAEILNRMALICGEIKDYERQEKLYREAARLSRWWNGPLFNLALSFYRQGRHAEALTEIDRAIEGEENGPELVLKAMIMKSLGQSKRAINALLESALSSFRSPLSSLNDFELGWYRVAAGMLADTRRKREADAENRRRHKVEDAVAEGELPGVTGSMIRR